MAKKRTMSVGGEETTIVRLPKHTLEFLRKLGGLTATGPGAIIERWASTHGKDEMHKFMREELKKSEKKA